MRYGYGRFKFASVLSTSHAPFSKTIVILPPTGVDVPLRATLSGTVAVLPSALMLGRPSPGVQVETVPALVSRACACDVNFACVTCDFADDESSPYAEV